MSTLKVTNIQATGETASRAVSGVAAAWVCLNQQSTQSIRDSVNIASISDTGTGRTDISFTSNLSNSDYCASGSAENGGGYNDARMTNRENGQPRSASTFGMYTVNGGSSTVNPYSDDANHVNISFHGDLA